MTTAEQLRVASDLDVVPYIEPEEQFQYRVYFLADYIRSVGASGLVLGISGGQDSALAGKLSQRAVEYLRAHGYEASFYAMKLPYGTQKDAYDVELSLKWIEPDYILSANIKETVDTAASAVAPLSDYHRGNIKARTRAMFQYAVAGERNLLVVGTDHAAEAVTGFFTKFGDGAADVLPLSGLTKRQGRQLLEYLGAPSILYTKAPTADLLDGNPGQKDEDELGLTYDQIDDYLEGKDVDSVTEEKILGRYAATQHKRLAPVTPADTWWFEHDVHASV